MLNLTPKDEALKSLCLCAGKECTMTDDHKTILIDEGFMKLSKVNKVMVTYTGWEEINNLMMRRVKEIYEYNSKLKV